VDTITSPGPRMDREAALEFGLVLPTLTGVPGDMPLGWRDHLALARSAETVGFDSIWIPDELLYEHDDAPPNGWWEGWSFLAAVAASVPRVEIGSFVTCTNYRNPALLAKMAASVDEISGGRLILGLGAGWSERQFRTFGYPADHLFGRFEEALAIIDALLRDGRVTFEGRYLSASDARQLPAGPRPGGIPIMLGGTSARMVDLSARHADAWNAFLIGGTCVPERLKGPLAALDAACVSIGRDPASIVRSAGIMVAFTDAPFLVGAADWAAGALRGTLDEIADGLLAFGREGLGLLQVGLSPPTPASVEEFGRVIELVRQRRPSPA
jgi:alkanesulfonate monooxygenase SsuD/methylene tetrahydromethanopterin reductase-like flavin-dependent oxidoreductase (luciferase family)